MDGGKYGGAYLGAFCLAVVKLSLNPNLVSILVRGICKRDGDVIGVVLGAVGVLNISVGCVLCAVISFSIGVSNVRPVSLWLTPDIKNCDVIVLSLCRSFSNPNDIGDTLVLGADGASVPDIPDMPKSLLNCLLSLVGAKISADGVVVLAPIPKSIFGAACFLS